MQQTPPCDVTPDLPEAAEVARDCVRIERKRKEGRVRESRGWERRRRELLNSGGEGRGGGYPNGEGGKGECDYANSSLRPFETEPWKA